MGLFSSLFGYAAKREFYNYLKAREKAEEYEKQKERRKAIENSQTYTEIESYHDKQERIAKEEKSKKRQIIAVGSGYRNKLSIIDNLLKSGVLGKEFELGINTRIQQIDSIITKDDKFREQMKFWCYTLSLDQINEFSNVLNLEQQNFIGSDSLEPNFYTTLVFMLNETKFIKNYKRYLIEKDFDISVIASGLSTSNKDITICIDKHLGLKEPI